MEIEIVERRLGPMFRKERELAGFSQEEVSRKVGCSAKTIARFEKGSTDLSVERFRLATLAIGKTVWNFSEVLDGSSEEG